MKPLIEIDPHDLIILVITASSEQNMLIGRTMLQKLCYFILNKLDIENDFVPHYYGPYSPTITKMLGDLIEVKLIEEVNSLTENNRNMYAYFLTEDGMEYSNNLMSEYPQIYNEAEKIIQNLIIAPGDKIETISYAAKIHYINKKKNNIISYKKMSETDVPSNIYGWNIKNNELMENGKKLLLSLEE